jgi:sialidase-1
VKHREARSASKGSVHVFTRTRSRSAPHIRFPPGGRPSAGGHPRPALTAIWAVAGNAPASHAAAAFLWQPFVANTGGYDCYRLPAIVTTTSGVVLAFSEARADTCSDIGDIDLVLRRSTDNGRTWEPGMQVLRGGGDHGGFQNPVPMVDRAGGRVSVS